MAVAGRLWRLPVHFHVLALAVLLGVGASFVHLGDTFTADEGAYAIQVRALDRGSWEYRYGAERYDPTGRWLPLRNATHSDKGWFSYVKHPAFPLAQLAATRVLGETVGLYAWSILGTLGVAAAAWAVAGEIDRRASRGSFWLAAAGPVLLNGYLALAHAPSAALCGVATFAALRVVRTSSAGWAALLISSVAGGVLLRSEGLLFAGALACGMLVVSRREGASRSRVGRVTMPAAVVGVAAVATYAERAWVTSIIGGRFKEHGVRGEDLSTTVASGSGMVDFLEGRLEGAWHSLLAGANDSESGALLVAAALMLVGFAGWSAARRGSSWARDVAMGLGGAVGLLAVRWATGPTETITGLLAAWPVVIVGIAVLLARRRVGTAKVLVGTVSLYAVAVLATQYRYGGGFEWGGRFFSPTIVPLAVLACLGLLELVESLPDRRQPVVALIVALTLAPVVTGLTVVHNVRPLLGDVVDDVEAGGAKVFVTHSPALPLAAWRTYPDVTWLVVGRTELLEAVTAIRRASDARVGVVVFGSAAAQLRATFPEATELTAPGAARLGWRALVFDGSSP